MPFRTGALATALLLALPVTAALADSGKHGKPDKDDRIEQPYQKKGGKPDKQQTHGKSHRLGDQDRKAVNEYFRAQFQSGNCPPGLAKKGKGCTPPGQARKWRTGHPLPSGTRTYPLPPELLSRLPAPPVGQEYVRVANDVLTIASGTSTVLDAIRDIGR